jgi:hypothetical protein
VILKGDGMSKRLPLTIDGFQAGLISTQHASDGEILISYQMGGSGPPLLLLHGFPQTKMIWHRVAPALAKHFTVIYVAMVLPLNHRVLLITRPIPNERWRVIRHN